MIKSNSQTIIKKVSAGIAFSFIIFLNVSVTPVAFAQTDPQKDPRQYVALTTIPGLTIGCKPTADGNTSACPSVNPVDKIVNIYGVAIGIAAILAVVRIIIAGLKYATTEAIDGKSDAKDTWQGAFYGLGLLLVSFLLLRTINIDLVNVNLHLGTPFVNDKEIVVAGGLYDYAKQTEDTATAAIAQNQVAQQRLTVVRNDLENVNSRMEALQADLAKIDRTNTANEPQAQAIQRQIDALAPIQTKLTADYVSTGEAAQVVRVTASAAKGSADVANALKTGDIELANSLKTSTSEVLAREVSVLTPGQAQDKAIATKMAFDGLSAQQISVSNSIKDVRGDVIKSMARGVSDGGSVATFNIAYEPAVQETIKNARTALASQFSATEVQIRAKDPTQLEAFRKETLKQREAFDTAVGKEVGCPNGIKVSSDGTVSCK